MGLDMYLKRSAYLPNYEHDKEGQKLAQAVLGALGVDKERYKNTGITVDLQVAYWRKANAIHGWFVRNVQDNVDDCETYEVSSDQLLALRTLCQGILDENISREELPPVDGFFFGKGGDDEYYFDDLRETVKQIDAALAEPNIGKWSDTFKYRSSW